MKHVMAVLMMLLLLLLLLLGGSGSGGRSGCLLLLAHFTLFFDPLLEMNFGVPFLFVGPGEFPTANITRKWLFAGMGADVRCQMIRSTK